MCSRLKYAESAAAVFAPTPAALKAQPLARTEERKLHLGDDCLHAGHRQLGDAARCKGVESGVANKQRHRHNRRRSRVRRPLYRSEALDQERRCECNLEAAQAAFSGASSASRAARRSARPPDAGGVSRTVDESCDGPQCPVTFSPAALCSASGVAEGRGGGAGGGIGLVPPPRLAVRALTSRPLSHRSSSGPLGG